MNLDELRSLIAAGESERLELKGSTGSLRDAMKTICFNAISWIFWRMLVLYRSTKS